jgi:transcriptional regulator with XRE-family HTH domain
MSPGSQLRALREAKGMGLRDVERDSRQWADDLGQDVYLVSHNYLAEVEADRHRPSIFKLYTLSAVYNVDLLRLVALYGMSAEDILRAEPGLELPGAQGDSNSQEMVNRPTTLPATPGLDPGLDQTRLLLGGSSLWGRSRGLGTPASARSPVLYGVIGSTDLTMDPLLPPGSLLQIDSGRNEVETPRWRNEYERPIYFMQAAKGFACGWCEVGDSHLSLIPHPLSPVRIRQFRYPDEVEIVGRVTAATISLIRAAEQSADFQRE